MQLDRILMQHSSPRDLLRTSSPAIGRRGFGIALVGTFVKLLSLPAAAQSGARPPAPSASAGLSEYQFGAGDKLRIVVFGEPDLSGEFIVDGAGRLSLPLIGQVEVGGSTFQEAQRRISDRLRDGYLINPQVAIEVMNYRPFFILGEVNRPGSYPYVAGITVLNAVAIGGGYTYRARKDRILVVRGHDSGRTERSISEDATILPGDIIRVPERFF